MNDLQKKLISYIPKLRKAVQKVYTNESLKDFKTINDIVKNNDAVYLIEKGIDIFNFYLIDVDFKKELEKWKEEKEKELEKLGEEEAELFCATIDKKWFSSKVRNENVNKKVKIKENLINVSSTYWDNNYRFLGDEGGAKKRKYEEIKFKIKKINNYLKQ